MSHHNLDKKCNNKNNNQTILATDIPLTVSETELCKIFKQYGSVNKIQKLSNLSCCLIEFSDSHSATSLVQNSKFKPFYIESHKIKLEFSSQSINSIDNKSLDNSTNILNINVSNVKYPITVDIIKQICLKYGKILRIFIGKKTLDNIVECLVEFDKISEAKSAKESLHGEDIYSGCCSLDVKYSKISSVPVLRNDEESWDFTKSQPKLGILKPPINGTVTNNNALNLFNQAGNPSSLYPPPIYNYPPPITYHNPIPVSPIPHHHHPYACQNLMYNYSNLQKNSQKVKPKLDINKDAFIIESGVVFMIYNLPFNICVDHLFNVFCLYGNVSKVRFLINQPGTAMVQMGSKLSVETCIQYLNGKTLFGQEMRLIRCSKPEIFSSKTIEFLPNGTPAFKDFSTDSNNRFLNDHGISSNKILEPNRTLHFFNAPYTFIESDLSNMIIQSGVPRPLNIIIFNNKNDHVKKCIGLFEFHRLEDSLVALSVLNHKPIIIPDTNQVFHLKLTFSAREPKIVSQSFSENKRAIPTRENDESNPNKRLKSEIKDDFDKIELKQEPITEIDNVLCLSGEIIENQITTSETETDESDLITNNGWHGKPNETIEKSQATDDVTNIVVKPEKVDYVPSDQELGDFDTINSNQSPVDSDEDKCSQNPFNRLIESTTIPIADKIHSANLQHFQAN